jgi:hypothetical protein
MIIIKDIYLIIFFLIVSSRASKYIKNIFPNENLDLIFVKEWEDEFMNSIIFGNGPYSKE